MESRFQLKYKRPCKILDGTEAMKVERDFAEEWNLECGVTTTREETGRMQMGVHDQTQS